MKQVLEITDKEIGFQYNAVKNLLTKFAEIKAIEDKLEGLHIRINYNPNSSNELSNALLWRQLREWQNIPNLHKTIVVNKDAKIELDKRHFFDRLIGRKVDLTSNDIPFHFETFSPFRDEVDSEGKQNVDEIYEHYIKPKLNVSTDIEKEVEIHILEVLNNVFNHSNTNLDAGFVSSKKESGVLSVCTVDIGQGIKKSFTSNPHLVKDYKHLSDESVIKKATSFRTSCNPIYSRHPEYKSTRNAGIGLYYLKKFSSMHIDGQLVIMSDKGYYYVDGRKEIIRNFGQYDWPGTLVYFRVNLNQKVNPKYIELAQSA